MPSATMDAPSKRRASMERKGIHDGKAGRPQPPASIPTFSPRRIHHGGTIWMRRAMGTLLARSRPLWPMNAEVWANIVNNLKAVMPA
jgi:hypothetical protein